MSSPCRATLNTDREAGRCDDGCWRLRHLRSWRPCRRLFGRMSQGGRFMVRRPIGRNQTATSPMQSISPASAALTQPVILIAPRQSTQPLRRAKRCSCRAGPFTSFTCYPYDLVSRWSAWAGPLLKSQSAPTSRPLTQVSSSWRPVRPAPVFMIVGSRSHSPAFRRRGLRSGRWRRAAM
jgi:hypothetical protein